MIVERYWSRSPVCGGCALRTTNYQPRYETIHHLCCNNRNNNTRSFNDVSSRGCYGSIALCHQSSARLRVKYLFNTIINHTNFADIRRRNFSVFSHLNKMASVSPESLKQYTTESKVASNINYPTYFVEINTCAELYQNNPKRNQPYTGVDLNIGYIDTKPGVGDSIPTILALHGAPGKGIHFKELFERLPDVRIVAPDFPGFGSTLMDQDHMFRHSPPEKATLVTDFLEAIGIQRVDLLIAHSAASYTSILLCIHNATFKSLLLLNPASHKSRSVLRPAWMAALGVKLSRNSLLRYPIHLSIQALTRVREMPIGSPAELLSGAETLLNSNMYQVPFQLQELYSQKFPMVIVISSDDRLVLKRDALEMAENIQLLHTDFHVVSADGTFSKSDSPMPPDRYVQGILLEKGTHFGMRTYPDVIVTAIRDVIARARS